MTIPACVFEVSLTTRDVPARGEIIKNWMLRLGLDPCGFVESHQGSLLRFSAYVKKQAEARRLVRILKSGRLRRVTITQQCLRKDDWVRPFWYGQRPFRLSRSFMVVPPETDGSSIASNRHYSFIRLETGLAFGTGHHPTTQLMAHLIERCCGKITSILDIGTGTGILAIVAAHCGAQKVLALDHDPHCIRAARRHLRLNQVTEAKIIKADFRTWSQHGQFDMVLANLLSHDLIDMKNKIVAKVRRGGYLAISGIAVNHAASVKTAFRQPSLVCLRVLRKNRWAAILYKKKIKAC